MLVIIFTQAEMMDIIFGLQRPDRHHLRLCGLPTLLYWYNPLPLPRQDGSNLRHDAFLDHFRIVHHLP